MFANKSEMISRIVALMQDGDRIDRFLSADRHGNLSLSVSPPADARGGLIVLAPHVHVPWVREFDSLEGLAAWAEALIDRLAGENAFRGRVPANVRCVKAGLSS